MTNQEKHFNKGDLKGFKNSSPTSDMPMIPGINNVSKYGRFSTQPNSPKVMDEHYTKFAQQVEKSPKPKVEIAPSSPQVDFRSSSMTRYNPITNPVPYMNYNPYVLKGHELDLNMSPTRGKKLTAVAQSIDLGRSYQGF